MPKKRRRLYDGPPLYVLLQPTARPEKVRCPECGNIISSVQVHQDTGPVRVEQWCRWCKTIVTIVPWHMADEVVEESRSSS